MLKRKNTILIKRKACSYGLSFENLLKTDITLGGESQENTESIKQHVSNT